MADVVALLDACLDNTAGLRDKAILLFLLDTGCRAGGLFSLKVDDLDLQHLRANVLEKGEKGRTLLLVREPGRRWRCG